MPRSIATQGEGKPSVPFIPCLCAGGMLPIAAPRQIACYVGALVFAEAVYILIDLKPAFARTRRGLSAFRCLVTSVIAAAIAAALAYVGSGLILRSTGSTRNL